MPKLRSANNTESAGIRGRIRRVSSNSLAPSSPYIGASSGSNAQPLDNSCATNICATGHTPGPC